MALIIGQHARVASGTYAEVIETAFQLVSDNLPEAIPCVALFIAGPRNTRINITPEIAESFAQLLARRASSHPAQIVFHASYMDLPWSAMSIRDDVFARIDRMVALCEVCNADLVIHSGSRIFDRRDRAAAIARIGKSLGRTKVRIFLETMQHDDRYADQRELNAIFDDAHKGIGLCIDTAHIWAAGADISTRAKCAEWLSAIRDDIPVAMHLNDSKEVIGSRVDAHTTLGSGEIWGLEDGYVAALHWARDRCAPVILERNDNPTVEVVHDLGVIRAAQIELAQ